MDMVASAEPSQMLIDHRALERRARRYSSDARSGSIAAAVTSGRCRTNRTIP